MGKKNLDKLFQEKLKDFPEMPDEKVWQSIEASLNKKKKSRRIIPLWWKLGGVAAVLLIAITILNPFNNNSDNGNTSTVTDVNVDKENTSEERKTDNVFETEKTNEDKVFDSNEEIIVNTNDKAKNQVENTNSTSQEDLKTNISKKSSKQKRFSSQNAIDVQVADADNRAFEKNLKQQSEAVTSEKEIDTINNTEVAESVTTKSTVEKGLNENIATENNRPLSEKNTLFDEGIAENKNEESIEEKENTKKKSIFDEIAEQQEEENAIVENKGGKWSAGPSVAPVYFNAMGEGSPVHSIFVPNSKSGDINLSYGLSVAYEVNKKLSIRSGIHKVDYGYRTNDIEFSSSLENATSSQIDNIDYTVTSRSLVVSSKANTQVEAFNQNPFINTNSADVSAVSTPRDGVMEQQFGYLEVPVELNYALLDKRFGINIIGGVSSLFLVDNSISLSSGELTTNVGEANNINSVNFSTNVGFGLNYEVTPKVQLNVEPVFKYQLNTFSETDGTFNPFSVGVYSGLSFRF